MSTIQLKISDQDLGYVTQVADATSCSLQEAAEMLFHNAIKAQRDWEGLQERARRGRMITHERYLELLNKAPDVPPMPGDELPEGWKQTEK